MVRVGPPEAPQQRPGRWPPIEALVFDAEGVIADTESLWDEGQRIFLGRRGIEYDRESVKTHLTGRSLEDGTHALIDLFGLSEDPAALARERANVVRDLMSSVTFIPGFPDFYERVRGDFKTCVASAMADDLFEIVDRRLGIRRLFDGRVYLLSEVGFRSKPDPALFFHAASRIDVAPASCVVIEDSPAGVSAGRAAGMRVVGLATTYRPALLADADVVVSEFDELDLKRLAQLEPSPARSSSPTRRR